MRQRRKFVLFGDSLTQRGFEVEHRGWAAALANAYTRKADVINRGYSGYNTRWALQIKDEVYAQFGEAKATSNDVLVIFFGANDNASADGTSSNQHVPLDEYKNNLITIVQEFRQKQKQYGDNAVPQIVLMSPPPVDEKAWALHCNENSSNRTLPGSRKYAEACQEVSQEHKTHFVNLWNTMSGCHRTSSAMGGFSLTECFSDGLHFSSKGNEVVFRSLMEVIEYSNDLKSPDEMQLDAPLWSDAAADMKCFNQFES